MPVVTANRLGQCDKSGVALWVVLVAVFWIVNWCATCPVAAQTLLEPLPPEPPAPNRSRFGFPYPAPSPGEPGVTPFRRYMLDGSVEFRFCPRPQDQIWLVSTHGVRKDRCHAISAGTCNVGQCDGLECYRIVNRQWERGDMAALISDHLHQPSLHTFMFVHGNRTNEFWGQRRGKQAYQALFGNRPEAPPVRFVIWSWPAEKTTPPIRDFELKMERALFDGVLLAGFLSSIRGDSTVALMGFSLGTQIILSGLSNLTTPDEPMPQFRLSLVAPVTHCHWPPSPDEAILASQHIQSVNAFRNPQDYALRVYKWYCRAHCKSSAQCRKGIDALAVPPERFSQIDVSRVGKEHNLVEYLKDPAIRAQSRLLIEP